MLGLLMLAITTLLSKSIDRIIVNRINQVVNGMSLMMNWSMRPITRE